MATALILGPSGPFLGPLFCLSSEALSLLALRSFQGTSPLLTATDYFLVLIGPF
jgi:hypothetical protein